ncbi:MULTISPECIES: NlpC/P60 family protein [unclassified Variovorax]|uniref:NlpC/P60 family protein n=1 Tax=unclassified Variovorax TaxID=663243 RepID=UPI001BD33939|nr:MULTISPECIES: NlpC/P60 family protein [unclassified Variovorax]
MNMNRIAPVAALCIVLATLGLSTQAASDTGATQRVIAAVDLVQQLDLSNTDYAHGQGSVSWTGVVASHTDCSGFIDHLLMHVDGYSADDFKRWFGSRRPTAERYHDAVLEGRGFVALAAVSDLQPGDVIAVKYLTRHDNTGHIMMVVNAPTKMSGTKPFVIGTDQWAVDVIDSSESGHGPTDTRHKRGADGHDHDGLGRGVFRLYTGSHGEVAGFAWSTLAASRFIAPDDEHAVLGRFIPHFRP